MKEISWVPLAGQVQYDNGELKYIPIQATEGPKKGEYGFSLVKSNILFENGAISFKVKLKDQLSKCQLILNQGEPEEINIGLNFGGSAYGISTWKNSKWEGIDGAGDPKSLPLDVWIDMRIEVAGSVIQLYYQGVLVAKGNCRVIKSQLAFIMNGPQEISIKEFSTVPWQPKAFVVMQFTEEFNSLYSEVIKPTCEKYGLQCVRADDIYNSTQIIEDITRMINEAYLIIADITPNNPNVFYELGYAHGIKKPTILLCDKEKGKLPFDVSGFRTLFYHNSIGGKRAIEENLGKYLNTIMGLVK